jgi:DNA-binding transcriptional LysR family regulator
MEDKLGTKLLYRSSHGVELTPAGQALLYHGRLVLQQLERLRADLQEYAKGVKGHLRIFANTTAIEFLPALLRTYLTIHPDVNVDLQGT